MTSIDAEGRLRFGIFLAPFHPVGQNPTLALERDLELIEHLDRLGFDEAWFGEHHSAGYEIIASPEVFIAAAAQRTKHIRLGTGVSSLPYHQPFMLADRIVLLDHLTRGRVMLGVGPGALPSDAYMMGIDPAPQRDMMEESLEAILLLLAGETSPWRPTGSSWSRPGCSCSPTSGRCPRWRWRRRSRRPVPAWPGASAEPALARGHHRGRLRRARRALARDVGAGRGVLDHGRPQQLAPGGADAHRRHEGAGRLRTWPSGWRNGSTTSNASPRSPLAPNTDNFDSLVDALNASGIAVIGTVEDAIAQIERLVAQSGGFGTFLCMGHEWADTAATRHSYELLARYVAPHFQGISASR